MMFATSLALLAAAYQGRDRGTAFGIWGATIGAAVAVGPLVGGVLTEALGWEAIFFVNMPIGIGVIVLTLRTSARVATPPAGAIDWAGLVTFSGVAVPARLRADPRQRGGLGEHADRGMLVGAGRADGGVRRRSSARTSDPMLELSLFRKPAFVGASIAAFVAVGVDVRDVPVPDALHPEPARLLARSRPACASCR